MKIFHSPLIAVFLLALPLGLPARLLVNQSGYNSAESKRFTAPLAEDGTPFEVLTHLGEEVVYTGTVTDGVGDFSDLRPAVSGHYLVRLGGERSHVFGIGPNWMERVSYRRMIQFMIDSRSGYGDASTWDVENTPAGATSIAWRDSAQYSFELRTLIQWYAVNPDAFGLDRMPVEGVYEGLRHTLPDDTPEIVRLIHWGVDIYLRGQVNHTLLKEELAYFVYYYPLFEEWIPEALYLEARDHVAALWGDTAKDRWEWNAVPHSANLFEVDTAVGGTKGSHPPGHSIIPNLLMHGVALRDGLPNPEAYLSAARAQAQWVVDNLDPADPAIAKGQRMSEHILVTALAEFLRRDPDGPVTGVRAWLGGWAEVMISRSNNYWDYRKYTDELWTADGWSQEGYWNEPGGVAGFPACLYAVRSALPEGPVADRLGVLAVSHHDHVFGRNPYDRHFSHRAAESTHGFEGVERGWFNQYIGGFGNLQNVRGVLDASPKHPAYPYDPDAPIGYTEGWIAFNTAWKAAMAWSALDRTRLEFSGPDGGPAGSETGGDGFLRVRLNAPLNFDDHAVETARVTLVSAAGDRERTTLPETRPGGSVFAGEFRISNAAVQPGDGILQAPPGGEVTVSYGHDVFAATATIVAAAVAEPAPTAPRILTAELPAGQVGVPYNHRLVLGGGRGTVDWSLADGAAPPAGLVLTGTGILRGTPEAAGGYDLAFDAVDDTGGSASAVLRLTIRPHTEFILDAGGPGTTVTGTWKASGHTAGYHGADYLQDLNAGKGEKSVAYPFTGLVPGTYALHATWTAESNRAPRVPVRIETGGKAAWIHLNQQIDPLPWNPLGTFEVTEDGALTVTLLNGDTEGYVIADAFRLTLLRESASAVYRRWAEERLPEGERDAGHLNGGVPNLLYFYTATEPGAGWPPPVVPLGAAPGGAADIFVNDGLPGIRVSLMACLDLQNPDWREILDGDAVRDRPSDADGRRRVPLRDSGYRFFHVKYAWAPSSLAHAPSL